MAIDSTGFGSGGLYCSRRWLYLKFHSGEIYRYFDFPPIQYGDFLAAESKGNTSANTSAITSRTNNFLNFATLADKPRPTSDAYLQAAI